MDSQPTVQERGREEGREREKRKKMSGTKVYVVIRKQNKGVPDSFLEGDCPPLASTCLHTHMNTHPAVTHNLVLINLRQPEDFYSLLVV